MDDWAWTSPSEDESRKGELKLACLIVVLFGMKSDYETLNDDFKFIHEVLNVNLSQP